MLLQKSEHSIKQQAVVMLWFSAWKQTITLFNNALTEVPFTSVSTALWILIIQFVIIENSHPLLYS